MDWERIHVGPQSNSPVVTTSSVNDAYNPGSTDTALDLVHPKGAELLGNDCRRAVFFEAEFRVSVKVSE